MKVTVKDILQTPEQCNTFFYILGCAGIEDEKLKKHKAELFMLTCLGIFYLLLIFFTCVSNYLSYKQSN